MRIVLGSVLGMALVALALAGGDARALDGEVVIPGPPGSASFGEDVIVLPNGNLVVVDPDYGLTATLTTWWPAAPDGPSPTSTRR